MKHPIRAAVLTACTLVAGSAAMAAPLLISVDLQSSYPGEGTAYSGVELGAKTANAAFGSANVWNVLETTGLQITNYASGPLTDSTGAATTASFSITGVTSAYGRDTFSTSALLRDYFYWNTDRTSAQIDWQIAGLTASTLYAFYTYGSNSDAFTPRVYSMLVDTDGDGLLTDETATSVSSTASASGVLTFVKTDASGVLRGRNTGVGGVEANWAGFQLAQVNPPVNVPEPGSAALVLLALGLMGAAPLAQRAARARTLA